MKKQVSLSPQTPITARIQAVFRRTGSSCDEQLRKMWKELVLSEAFWEKQIATQSQILRQNSTSVSSRKSDSASRPPIIINQGVKPTTPYQTSQPEPKKPTLNMRTLRTLVDECRNLQPQESETFEAINAYYQTLHSLITVSKATGLTVQDKEKLDTVVSAWLTLDQKQHHLANQTYAYWIHTRDKDRWEEHVDAVSRLVLPTKVPVFSTNEVDDFTGIVRAIRRNGEEYLTALNFNEDYIQKITEFLRTVARMKSPDLNEIHLLNELLFLYIEQGQLYKQLCEKFSILNKLTLKFKTKADDLKKGKSTESIDELVAENTALRAQNTELAHKTTQLYQIAMSQSGILQKMKGYRESEQRQVGNSLMSLCAGLESLDSRLEDLRDLSK